MMNKIYDPYIGKYGEFVSMPKKIEIFLKELTNLCKTYNLSIAHEDRQGSFIIEKYDKDNIAWLYSASKGYEGDD